MKKIICLAVCLTLTGVSARSETSLRLGASDADIVINVAASERSLLLFGAAEAGGDIVLRILGPPRPLTVIRREQFYGRLWINSQSDIYHDAPSFIRIASTAPLENLLDEKEKIASGLALDKIMAAPQSHGDAIRQRYQEKELWFCCDALALRADGLFSYALALPADAPVGTYRAEAMLVKNGRVAASARAEFAARYGGLNAVLERLSRGSGLLYGVLAVLMALLMGFASAILFRRLA